LLQQQHLQPKAAAALLLDYWAVKCRPLEVICSLADCAVIMLAMVVRCYPCNSQGDVIIKNQFHYSKPDLLYLYIILFNFDFV
jgi:hypothetical protein